MGVAGWETNCIGVASSSSVRERRDVKAREEEADGACIDGDAVKDAQVGDAEEIWRGLEAQDVVSTKTEFV